MKPIPCIEVPELTEDAVFDAIRKYNADNRYPDAGELVEYFKIELDCDDIKINVIYQHCIRLQKEGWIIKDFQRGGYRIA